MAYINSMLSDLHIGYLAGILDSDGCITIRRGKRNDRKPRLRNYELSPTVTVTQRRRRLLEHIITISGPDSASIYIHRGSKLRNYYILRFKSQWLRDNLPALLPHLSLKREQAEIALWFLAHSKSIGRTGLSEEAWAERDQMWARCGHLNQDRSNGED